MVKFSQNTVWSGVAVGLWSDWGVRPLVWGPKLTIFSHFRHEKRILGLKNRFWACTKKTRDFQIVGFSHQIPIPVKQSTKNQDRSLFFNAQSTVKVISGWYKEPSTLLSQHLLLLKTAGRHNGQNNLNHALTSQTPQPVNSKTVL